MYFLSSFTLILIEELTNQLLQLIAIILYTIKHGIYTLILKVNHSKTFWDVY